MTVAFVISSINLQTLNDAKSHNCWLTPFSNLVDASVLKDNLLDESLIVSLSKLAASISTLVVFDVISESKPPIIPAIPNVFSPSQIIISSDNSRSTSSNVVNFCEPDSFTIIFLSAILSKS